MSQNLKKVLLTHRLIETMKPQEKSHRASDLRCSGLSVRIAASGVKSWELAVRIRGAGKVRRKSLGKFPAISLEHARKRASTITNAAQAGIDLIEEERKCRAADLARITVEQLIGEYTKRATDKLRTGQEIRLRLKRSLHSLRDRPADSIKRRDIRALLELVFDRGTEREAEKRRQAIGAMFSWGVSQDYLEDNPVRGLKPFSTGKLRDRTLSLDELSVFWKWLSNCDLSHDMADALRLQLCLGARIGEVSGIDRSEIDQLNWVWTLPPARSKNKKARITPLVGVAKDILEKRLVETAKGPLFVNETGKYLRSNDIGSAIITRRKRIPIAHFVSHDLRRTVATELVDMGISLDVVAAVLGHEAGDKTTRILTRHYVRTSFVERKRTALEAWDKRLRFIADGGLVSTNVVPLSDILRQEQRLVVG